MNTEREEPHYVQFDLFHRYSTFLVCSTHNSRFLNKDLFLTPSKILKCTLAVVFSKSRLWLGCYNSALNTRTLQWNIKECR